MRIAFISAVKRTLTDDLRAEKILAGRSVLAWQIDLALAVGCERIICQCNAPSDEVISQQRRVEALGASFHTVRGHLQLVGLVRAEDELFIQLDGLLAARELVDTFYGDDPAASQSILTVEPTNPLATAYPDDFERIDRERYWAGLALIPGERAAMLTDMPPDSDAISLLLRLALQGQVPCVGVSDKLTNDDYWILADDETALERRSQVLVDQSVPATLWSGPLTAAGTILVRSTATRWLGSGPELCGIAAISLLVVGVLLGGFAQPAAGLLVAGLGAFSASLARSSYSLRSALLATVSATAVMRAMPVIIAILSCLVLIMCFQETTDWSLRVALPVLAAGLTWLAAVQASKHIGAFWNDRALHFVLLGAAASLGFLQEGLLVFALGALVQLMLRTGSH